MEGGRKVTRAGLEMDAQWQPISAEANGKTDGRDSKWGAQEYGLPISIKGVHKLVIVHDPRLDLVNRPGR